MIYGGVVELCVATVVCYGFCICRVFFFKQKTAYDMRISDCSSDVCSSDLCGAFAKAAARCFGCGVVHRGHCRFAAVGGVLPRAATGPSNVVSAFFLGEERNIHRAAHARIVDAALIEAFTAGPDRLLEQRADLHPSAGGGRRNNGEL